jgi:hypothetical protein
MSVLSGMYLVYVNQHDFVSNIQTPSRSWFLLCFPHELLMSSISNVIKQYFTLCRRFTSNNDGSWQFKSYLSRALMII